jgi:hypothetical protein
LVHPLFLGSGELGGYSLGAYNVTQRLAQTPKDC